MALRKITPKAGVNRENTRYFSENGWYASQWTRFRQGTPEKIGGYTRVTANTFEGTCRALLNWVTLGGANLLGVGTNVRYYIENGGTYNNITPWKLFSSTGSLSNPFTTVNTSSTITVASSGHNLVVGSIVIYSGATAVGGISAATLNSRHVVTAVVDANTYQIQVGTTATSSTTGGGTVIYTYYSTEVKLTNPFTTNLTNPTQVQVTQTGANALVGDYVFFSGASAVGGITIAGFYRVFQYINANNYIIISSTPATSVATGGGTVFARYEIPVGAEFQTPTEGWGAGAWSAGQWGIGTTSFTNMRLWTHSNFGEALVFAPRGGSLYYWSPAVETLNGRGTAIITMSGADNVPLYANSVLISDVSRFVLVFGTNDIYTNVLDPMVIRWSDQESVVDWTPMATSQAGSLRLSNGSEIVARIQTRQEILVWTDTALYSLQYVGTPVVWGSTLMGDNISIIGPNTVALGAGVAFWMGNGKFYKYDGSVQTLRCDLRQYIFSDFNLDQTLQISCGTNEAFNEVWWFYPSANSMVPNRYVIYNYLEDTWAYGELTRFAWIDKNTRKYPMAAAASTIMYHENGVDDNSTSTTAPIPAYIESGEFDIDDGDHFGFVYRVLPDINFTGSTVQNPQVTLTLYPMQNSGSGFGTSIGGDRSASSTRTVAFPVEQFTGQVYIRVRGRQMVLRVESTGLGVTWQVGATRIDIRQDGRRGG